MENLLGGNDANDNLSTGIGIACGVIGIVSLVGSVFTFGASLAFGVTIAGAMCVGASIGIATARYI